MIVQVRLFALAKELAGTETLTLKLAEPATVGMLRKALAENAALGQLAPHILFAIDADYAPDSRRLEDGQTVACIPPVSGG